MSSLTSGIKLAPLMVDIKADIKSFKDDMSRVSATGVSEAKKISKELANVAKTGQKLSSVGTNLTKFVSLPLAGASIGVTKMAVDFESSFAKVSTLLDSNVVDFNDYKKNLLKASNESKVAVDEFSEAVYGSISAGVDQTKAIEFTTNAMKLAKGGFTDGAKAVDVMTTAINGYKLSTEDATRISDLLITTQNLGKTTVDELASSMGAVIPIASAANFSIDELSAAYAQMTKNGIATSETGTYVKSMLSELTKAGSITDKTLRKLTGKGFAQLKADGVATTDIFAMLNKYAEKNNITLKDMFGSVEAGSAAMVLASGNGNEYNEMLKAMEKSAGATQQAFEKIDATPAEQMKGALNKVKNANIELGSSLVPMFNKVADVISKVADKFGSLTEEQQENILKWGAITMVAGPALKLLGGGVKTFVNLKSVIGGTSKALGLFKKGASVASVATKGLAASASVAGGATGVGGLLTSLGGMAVSAAPFVAGAAVVGTAAYGIHKTLSKEVVPTVDLFADKVEYTSAIVGNEYGAMANQVQVNTIKISESTESAVQAYMDMDNEVTKSLYQQRIKQEVITEEMAQSMIGKFSNMSNSIKEGQKAKYEEMTADLTNFFNSNSSLTEIKEAEILQKVTEKHQLQQVVVDQTMARITEIYTNAKNENRNLKEQELNEINTLQEQMRTNAINTLSTTEEEAAVIRQRMKDYQGRLSAEMASEMIIKANEAREGEIKAANEKYDEVVRQASRLRQAELITQEEYDNMVNAAKETKDSQIKSANEACEGIKNEIKNATPGIEDEVEMQTGKIKSWYSKLKDSVSGFFDWLFGKNEEAEEQASNIASKSKADGSHYNGLSYVPFDGYTARLHKGERVLTAEENKKYTIGEADVTPSNFVIHVPVSINDMQVAEATANANDIVGGNRMFLVERGLIVN
ncbi:phage tail tape measure protein [Clostridium paraputrificum]|uniref:phage tail tape measure protein n=1 Tax=Clostridium paraputrificum TaxID=29363 RepID=UPI00232F2B42|nr:phage tail tape measure protein [Clostridium paraputrificum]MDB2101740.1 phage tail tape measure protein [Clostridium paraputrificum]